MYNSIKNVMIKFLKLKKVVNNAKFSIVSRMHCRFLHGGQHDQRLSWVHDGRGFASEFSSSITGYKRVVGADAGAA